MARSSLIHFHRFLITAGIVFCAGFAWWTYASGRWLLGSVFAVLAVILAIYLYNLSRFLGYEDEES